MSTVDSFKNIKNISLPIRVKNTLLSFKFWRWIILGAIIACGGFWFFWMSVPEAYVSRAERNTAKDIVLGTVEIREYHMLQLRSERSGMVLNTTVEIGDVVKSGQPLLRQDTEERKLDLERLMIDKDHFEQTIAITRPSEYNLLKTTEELEDLEKDVERGIRPERDLILAQRNFKQLKDNITKEDLNEELSLAQKENAIKKLRLDIEKMTVRSPVNGTIVNIMVREGDLVTEGEVIFNIIDARRIIVAEISEEEFDKIEEGLPALVQFLAYPNQRFQATVTQVLPTADPITQRYEIYLNVDMGEQDLTPGLTGEVSIIVDERDDSILVPSQAVIGNNVLRIRNSRVERVKVVTGYRSLLKVEIIEGIREGDIIVTEELTKYRDGELVRTVWE